MVSRARASLNMTSTPSRRKQSMILQDRWMGSEVVNRVRNQLEAYKLVWIAWDWKETEN